MCTSTVSIIDIHVTTNRYNVQTTEDILCIGNYTVLTTTVLSRVCNGMLIDFLIEHDITLGHQQSSHFPEKYVEVVRDNQDFIVFLKFPTQLLYTVNSICEITVQN